MQDCMVWPLAKRRESPTLTIAEPTLGATKPNSLAPETRLIQYSFYRSPAQEAMTSKGDSSAKMAYLEDESGDPIAH